MKRLSAPLAFLKRVLHRPTAPTPAAKRRAVILSSVLEARGIPTTSAIVALGVSDVQSAPNNQGGLDFTYQVGHLSIAIVIAASGRATYSTLDLLTGRIERHLKRATDSEITEALRDDLRLPARLMTPHQLPSA